MQCQRQRPGICDRLQDVTPKRTRGVRHHLPVLGVLGDLLDHRGQLRIRHCEDDQRGLRYLFQRELGDGGNSFRRRYGRAFRMHIDAVHVVSSPGEGLRKGGAHCSGGDDADR